MSNAQARINVINAEQEVTNILQAHGENSNEYKKALKNFAANWLTLTNREDQVNSLLED